MRAVRGEVLTAKARQSGIERQTARADPMP
jgi:hypothetical protein